MKKKNLRGPGKRGPDSPKRVNATPLLEQTMQVTKCTAATSFNLGPKSVLSEMLSLYRDGYLNDQEYPIVTETMVRAHGNEIVPVLNEVLGHVLDGSSIEPEISYSHDSHITVEEVVKLSRILNENDVSVELMSANLIRTMEAIASTYELGSRHDGIDSLFIALACTRTEEAVETMKKVARHEDLIRDFPEWAEWV